MKQLIYIIVVLIITNCNSQNKNTMKPYKQLTLEELKKQGYQYKEQDTFLMKDGKLNIKALHEKGTSVDASVPTDNGWKTIKTYRIEDTLDSGTSIYIRGNEVNGYSKKVTKKDNLLTTTYDYYASGNLKTTGVVYDNYFEKGTWYWYNERGQINRLEEYDRPYKFTWEDILIFLQEKNIKKEDFYKIRRNKITQHSNEKPVWFVAITKERGAFNLPTLVLIYTIDGITGKIIKEEKMDVTKHLD